MSNNAFCVAYCMNARLRNVRRGIETLIWGGWQPYHFSNRYLSMQVTDSSPSVVRMYSLIT
jgi:hypothetical protein